LETNYCHYYPIKNFFDWDRQRWLNDQNDFALGGIFSVDSRICTEERQEALKWEHRKKYFKGLTGFFLEFQVRYGTLDGKLFDMLDYMESKHNKKDVYFLKLLSEIDIRKQKIEKIENDGNLAFQISPNYSVDSSLEKEMKKNEEESSFQEEYSKYSLWITQIFLKKLEDNMTYDYWKKCLKYFQSYDKTKIKHNYPFPIGTLAKLGLDFFNEELTDDEFKFCVNTIIEIAQKLFEIKKKERFDFENFDFSISIYDNHSVYSSLPKLLNFKERLSGKQVNSVKSLTFFFLRDINIELDKDLKYLYNSFKKCVWIADYQYAYNCFVGIILFAEFFKKYPRHIRYSDEEIKIKQDEENKILNFIENNEKVYELSNLSYSKYSHWELGKAVEIFPIYEEFEFSYNFLKLIFNAHIESFALERQMYSNVDFHGIGFSIKETVIDFLFEIPFNENTKAFFEFLFNKGINHKLEKRINYDALKYIGEIIELFYYKVDDNKDSKKMLNNLWNFWEIFYEKVKYEPTLFNKEFLFYGKYWKFEADNWFVLNENNVANIYLKKIETLDYLNIEALMQLLSGIGFQSLMPQGIKVLTKNLKSDEKQLLSINYYYGEKLIMKCFKDKIKQIKEDDSLLNEFLWFLNIMVDLGSSKAYYIRENLILYKVVKI
jgi:hypothetical protein